MPCSVDANPRVNVLDVGRLLKIMATAPTGTAANGDAEPKDVDQLIDSLREAAKNHSHSLTQLQRFITSVHHHIISLSASPLLSTDAAIASATVPTAAAAYAAARNTLPGASVISGVGSGGGGGGDGSSDIDRKSASSVKRTLPPPALPNNKRLRVAPTSVNTSTGSGSGGSGNKDGDTTAQKSSGGDAGGGSGGQGDGSDADTGTGSADPASIQFVMSLQALYETAILEVRSNFFFLLCAYYPVPLLTAPDVVCVSCDAISFRAYHFDDSGSVVFFSSAF